MEKKVASGIKIFINEEGSYKIDDDNNLVKVEDVPEKFKKTA